MARIRGQGSNWIRRSTRFAIYHRDGFRCVYCGSTAEEQPLTLDHFVDEEIGGGSGPDNLVTAGHDCNSAKRNLPMREWLAFLRQKGVDTKGIAGRVRRQLRKKVDRAEGRRLAGQEDGGGES